MIISASIQAIPHGCSVVRQQVPLESSYCARMILVANIDTLIAEFVVKYTNSSIFCE